MDNKNASYYIILPVENVHNREINRHILIFQGWGWEQWLLIARGMWFFLGMMKMFGNWTSVIDAFFLVEYTETF